MRPHFDLGMAVNKQRALVERRPPQFTAADFAARCGVTTDKMRGLLRACGPAPRDKQFSQASRSGHGKVWQYNLPDLVRWWANLPPEDKT